MNLKTHKLKTSQTQNLTNSQTHKLTNSQTHRLKTSKTKITSTPIVLASAQFHLDTEQPE